MEYFLQNSFFSNKQFGFLKGRSTVLQLLQILDDWTAKLELGARIHLRIDLKNFGNIKVCFIIIVPT